MRDIHLDLAWLLLPENFAVRVKALRADEGNVGQAVRELAGYALDVNQLGRLARVISSAIREGRSLAPLMPLRLGLISNATTDFIVPAIVATGARHGFAIECVTADYGQIAQAAFDPHSVINAAGCDVVLLALDDHALELEAAPGDVDGAGQTVNAALDFIDNLRNALRRHGGSTVICQTVPLPTDALLGSFDAMLPGAARCQINAFNAGLAQRLFGTPDRLLDVASLAATVGLANWHDEALWNLAKQAFAARAIPIYADHVCRLLGAMYGKSRKALVLDLDNTLWGGIIGDDGMEGIRVAQGDALGEAHLALQKTALQLHSRGILLTVCSKNEDAVARQVFKEHPEMLLREEHIAVFQANWNDKGTNIKAIAEELSLGLDAFVFVDDNPVERALVRSFVPQVSVPEMPEDPAHYMSTLLAAGYFEAIGFSDEDRKRAAMYGENARRTALKVQAGNLDDYLASLDMVITFSPFDDSGRARITQLINKSNQFNLTTRRYTEAEVADAANDPAAFTLQVRLADRFGDNGMISVIIARAQGAEWTIDTWLMSCRVLGRRVEEAVLHELVTVARRQGIRRLIGIYRPTDRNMMVESHYQKLGFTATGAGNGEEVRWELDLSGDVAAPAFVGERVHTGWPEHALK